MKITMCIAVVYYIIYIRVDDGTQKITLVTAHLRTDPKLEITQVTVISETLNTILFLKYYPT